LARRPPRQSDFPLAGAPSMAPLSAEAGEHQESGEPGGNGVERILRKSEGWSSLRTAP
jgi:hypothetical protein